MGGEATNKAEKVRQVGQLRMGIESCLVLPFGAHQAHQGGRGAHHRFEQEYCRRTGHRETRRLARIALASECGRVAVFYQRQGAHDGVRHGWPRARYDGLPLLERDSDCSCLGQSNTRRAASRKTGDPAGIARSLAARFEQRHDNSRWPFGTSLRFRRFRNNQSVGGVELPSGHYAREAVAALGSRLVSAGDSPRIPGVSSNVIKRDSPARFIEISEVGLRKGLGLLRRKPFPMGGFLIRGCRGP